MQSDSASSRNGYSGLVTRATGTRRAITVAVRKCAGRRPIASIARLRWVASHNAQKALPGGKGSMPMPGWRGDDSSTKAARTGSGAEQARCAGTQYLSRPRRTGDCARPRQRILSRVCAHKRWRANAGSHGTLAGVQHHAGYVVGE